MKKARGKSLLFLCKSSAATAKKTKSGHRTSPEKFAFLKEFVLAKVKGKMVISVTDIHRYTAVSRETIYQWIRRAENNEPLDNTKRCGGHAPTVVTPKLIAEYRDFIRENFGTLMTRSIANAKFAVYRNAKAAATKRGKAAPVAPLKSKSAKNLRFKAKCRSVVARAKPELSVIHAPKRKVAAEKRTDWDDEYTKGIIWVDQACGSLADGARQTQVLTDDPNYVAYGAPTIARPDKKCEKVHYLIGIGNGWKSPFVHLPVKRPVERDAAGKALRRTLGNGRRKYDKNNPDKNKKLNLANEGETWTTKKVLEIVLGPAWLNPLKEATGVVFDNAPAHKQVIAALKKKGVKIIDHPPGSPDFNLCEQAHKAAKNRYGEATLAAMNNVQLLAAYKKNWEEYPVKKFDAHVKNYQNVMNECLAKNGGPTRY